jgi:hypothetical protein
LVATVIFLLVSGREAEIGATSVSDPVWMQPSPAPTGAEKPPVLTRDGAWSGSAEVVRALEAVCFCSWLEKLRKQK